jgi:chromosomal replication initiator protein
LENRTILSTNGADPWSACLTSLERDLPPQQFATWIRPLRCEPTSDGVRLVAPNRFVLQWVKDRFGPRISTMLRDATGNDLGVEFGLERLGSLGIHLDDGDVVGFADQAPGDERAHLPAAREENAHGGVTLPQARPEARPGSDLESWIIHVWPHRQGPGTGHIGGELK